VVESPGSNRIFGAAMETIVWSMKVIATAKIIAVRVSRLLGAPTAGASMRPVPLPGRAGARAVRARALDDGGIA
jgi:hypothetical protein